MHGAMDAPAYVGLELPCRRSIPAESCLFVLHKDSPIQRYAPCPGRLCPPRRVGPELKALLRTYTRAAEKEARLLAATQPGNARKLLSDATKWVADIECRYLTHHHLRTDGTHSFQAFRMAEEVRLQLVHKHAHPDPRNRL
jgi:hypothetical protein